MTYLKQFPKSATSNFECWATFGGSIHPYVTVAQETLEG